MFQTHEKLSQMYWVLLSIQRKRMGTDAAKLQK